MDQSTRFNYIITIHNKEDMIEKVLMCVLMCCRDNSRVYTVLDGCTDRTEEIVDDIIKTFANVPVIKVHTPDVHELLSINAGLRAADQDGDGFNIILQDDVLLADFFLEKKVRLLYEWAGPELGFVSFRLGANFKEDAIVTDDAIPLDRYVENVYGHGLTEADPLLPGCLAYRTVPIKSPVCIPCGLIRTVGIYEERLAPYGHDDTEYAIRVIQAGFRNAVFAVRFFSDIKWGGTRVKLHPQLGNIVKDNMGRIRGWHRRKIEEICSAGQPSGVVQVPGMVNEEESGHALAVWKENIEKLKDYKNTHRSGVSSNRVVAGVRSLLKRIMTG